MSGVFNFCPGKLVPETKPPAPGNVMSMNGWAFSARPNVPYLKEFAVMLYGVRWYLNSDGTYDSTTDPTFNARALELFYEANGCWDNFAWAHPHLGTLQVRFKEAVAVGKADPNSRGLVPAFEIKLVGHNPGY